MITTNIYLNFDGNCLEAFEFYKTIFGGEFPYVGTFGDMPPMEGMPEVPADEKARIMHVSLPISAETNLMGSDIMPSMGQKLLVGNNFSISVMADTTEDADRIFNALAVKGEITMPLAKTFWGAYYGQLIDQFGISWMLNVELHEEKF
ncbi:MAG: VOC family protein [Bacteroidales bacterium]|nr:VOC family protein [Bacteroidales bacterium]